jgi:hypothetical protein
MLPYFFNLLHIYPHVVFTVLMSQKVRCRVFPVISYPPACTCLVTCLMFRWSIASLATVGISHITQSVFNKIKISYVYIGFHVTCLLFLLYFH